MSDKTPPTVIRSSEGNHEFWRRDQAANTQLDKDIEQVVVRRLMPLQFWPVEQRSVLHPILRQPFDVMYEANQRFMFAVALARTKTDPLLRRLEDDDVGLSDFVSMAGAMKSKINPGAPFFGAEAPGKTILISHWHFQDPQPMHALNLQIARDMIVILDCIALESELSPWPLEVDLGFIVSFGERIREKRAHVDLDSAIAAGITVGIPAEEGHDHG